jgi:hypothetical protein
VLGNDRLRDLTFGETLPKDDRPRPRLIVEPQFERITAVPVPHLGRIDAVPTRDVARFEQIVDRRRM